MIKVEDTKIENNLETHIEKKKKRRRKKGKKVLSSDVIEGSNLSNIATQGSNPKAILVIEAPGQNEAQKSKRARRRKRNRKMKATQGEGVNKTEIEVDDNKRVDAGNPGEPGGEGSASVASTVNGATVVISSSAQRRRARRRQKRNKRKTIEGNADVELNNKNEINSNVAHSKESDAVIDCIDSLIVTPVEGINLQEKSEAEKLETLQNRKEIFISEGVDHVNQTSGTDLPNEDELKTLSLPGKKRRRRRRNNTGNTVENFPNGGDDSDKKIKKNSEEPIDKIMMVLPTDETPPQNAEVRNGPNIKKRRRNRRKKYDKEKLQKDIDSPPGSQDNEAKITEINERVQNRKRNIEQRKLEDTEFSLSYTQDGIQKNDNENTEEKNSGDTVKKMRLCPNEENGNPSTLDVEKISKHKRNRRNRNRKKLSKDYKKSAQDGIVLPAGSQENDVEVIDSTKSAKGESVETENKKNDLSDITESGTQLVKPESNEIGNKGKNNEEVNVSSLESRILSSQNLGTENSSYKKRKRRNRKRKFNKDNKEKGEENVNLLDKSQEKEAEITCSNENVQSKGKGITGISCEQGSNQNLTSRQRRRNNRKRKLSQNVQSAEITDEPKEKVMCGDNVAENASHDDFNSPVTTEKIEDEVTETKKEYPMSGSATRGPPELNTMYDEKDFKNEISKHWTEETAGLHKGFEITKEPFTCCYAPDFLKNADYLEGVKDELQDIELIMKSNDLYKFRQTSDLKNISTPYIAGLRSFLYGDFRKWLIDVTGIPLNDTVDMGSSRYEYTDVLLCHDDELEGRRIAYILYLVPPWEKEDGGSLDLFSTDEHGQPKDIVKSFVPKWNSYAFFEVSPVSFHQVAEVLSCDKVRLSINGWFHGPSIKRPAKYRPPSILLEAPTHIEEEDVYSWINPTYLDMDIQREIRHKFRSDSEIELESFLAEDKYQELADALKNTDLTWQQMGPANKQFFEALRLDKVPAIVDDCLKFLKSEAVFLIVSQLTGLRLHRFAPLDSESGSDTELNGKESCPRVGIDVRRWSHGCYTLIRDDAVENTCALDAHLFVNVSDKWSQEHGGFASYIAKDEDEELLTVVPQSNRFALVYRDAETLRFTKHINASVSELGNEDSCYNDFACIYYE